MKIVFFSPLMPTPDNLNGASALMFHLLKNRASKIELMIISTNANKADKGLINLVAEELNAVIYVTPRSFINKMRMYSKLNDALNIFRTNPISYDAYYKLSHKLIGKIHSFAPDLIWIYPCTYLGVANQLKGYKMIVSGCDCDALHISRLLRDSYVFEHNRVKQELKRYRMRIDSVQSWNARPNSYIYLVGKTDEEYFKTIAPNANVKFFQHPHYNLVDKAISFQKDKLLVLISGKFDIYTYSDSLEMTNALCASSNKKLRELFDFVFLGKGWDDHIERLKNSGFSARHQGWVEDYVSYVRNFDIQLFPISVGTGTKGKVLDALSTGILCVGSQYAFENIAVQPSASCLLYKNAKEVPTLLEDIALNRDHYEDVAKEGRNRVRKYHNPSVIVSDILNWVNNGDYALDTSLFYCLPLKS